MNNLQDQEDQDSQELKDLATQNAIEGFLADDKLKDKLVKLIGIIAIPAFNGIEKILGDDEHRYMIYRDKAHGIIIHKLKTETTDMSFEEPSPEDVYIIKRDDISNVEELLKTLISKFTGV